MDYVGTTILLYRGKNYIAPETIVPVHMLNKQEALRRAKAEQRAQSLLELEIQRQEELAKQRKRLEYSLKVRRFIGSQEANSSLCQIIVSVVLIQFSGKRVEEEETKEAPGAQAGSEARCCF